MYQCFLEVRGYELDSFNHVNNAVYLNYYEQARWEIIKDSGILEYFEKTGNFLVVVETHIKYFKEICLFDRLVIQTTISKEDPYLLFNQEMFLSDSKTKVSKATIKTILLDDTKTPIDLPDELLRICNG